MRAEPVHSPSLATTSTGEPDPRVDRRAISHSLVKEGGVQMVRGIVFLGTFLAGIVLIALVVWRVIFDNWRLEGALQTFGIAGFSLVVLAVVAVSVAGRWWFE